MLHLLLFAQSSPQRGTIAMQGFRYCFAHRFTLLFQHQQWSGDLICCSPARRERIIRRASRPFRKAMRPCWEVPEANGLSSHAATLNAISSSLTCSLTREEKEVFSLHYRLEIATLKRSPRSLVPDKRPGRGPPPHFFPSLSSPFL